jgi:predicted nucleic acid-binding Zn ribbon protein
VSGQPPRRGGAGGDAGGSSGRRRPDDRGSQVARDRRATAADRDEHLYERKRAAQRRRRAAAEREAYDPAPPDEEDWTVGAEQTDALLRITPPTTLDETLQELVRRRGWNERLQGASAWARWDRIVGEDLAARCEPVKLLRGVLTIRAESQVWATQLRYMIPQLTANVEAALGERTVREVRIVVGALEGRERPEA